MGLFQFCSKDCIQQPRIAIFFLIRKRHHKKKRMNKIKLYLNGPADHFEALVTVPVYSEVIS